MQKTVNKPFFEAQEIEKWQRSWFTWSLIFQRNLLVNLWALPHSLIVHSQGDFSQEASLLCCRDSQENKWPIWVVWTSLWARLLSCHLPSTVLCFHACSWAKQMTETSQSLFYLKIWECCYRASWRRPKGCRVPVANIFEWELAVWHNMR